MPTTHRSCASVLVHGLIVVIGGYDKKSKEPATLELLDPRKQEWTSLESLNVNCDRCDAAVLNINNRDGVVVVGDRGCHDDWHDSTEFLELPNLSSMAYGTNHEDEHEHNHPGEYDSDRKQRPARTTRSPPEETGTTPTQANVPDSNASDPISAAQPSPTMPTMITSSSQEVAYLLQQVFPNVRNISKMSGILQDVATDYARDKIEQQEQDAIRSSKQHGEFLVLLTMKLRTMILGCESSRHRQTRTTGR
mmetsp:Transcript_3074/g.6857  ORF Transcript_3074/g.6857 Transcript_3074/m.6857 type:complete len:250 (-) Transcript_3074:287-1036(-)